MHKSTFMPSLNAIGYILSEILPLKYTLKHLSTLRRNCDLEWRSKVISNFSRTIVTANVMRIAWRLSEIISVIYVWTWMEVKVNIINTWCILVSEAVTVPNLMMMTLIVSEESLARDTDTQTDWLTHTHTPTHTTQTCAHARARSLGSVILLKVCFAKKKKKNKNIMQRNFGHL